MEMEPLVSLNVLGGRGDIEIPMADISRAAGVVISAKPFTATRSGEAVYSPTFGLDGDKRADMPPCGGENRPDSDAKEREYP